MSRYTRFPGSEPRSTSSRIEQAERHFRSSSTPAMSALEKTANEARQIKEEEAAKRKNLTEALKEARLEREKKQGASGETKPESK